MSDETIQEPFEDLLENLVDPEQPLRASLIYRLSDPDPVEMLALQAIWEEVPVERRRLLLSRLAETSEVSIEVNFNTVALFAVQDEDPEVRSRSIDTLWEDDRPDTMRLFVRLLETDPDQDVRASAAQALGRFVLAMELGELAESHGKAAESVLIDLLLHGDETVDVHRRSLESIAYSSREEVSSLIEEAMTHSDIKMQASAIHAMGRSADERWADDVLRALRSDEPELRYEASRAAGELLLTDAVPGLIQLAGSDDAEIRLSAIWSLGEIGGEDAQRALINLADDETDDYVLDAIEDAMNMAALSTGDFATYIFSADDDDDFEELDELEGFDDL